MIIHNVVIGKQTKNQQCQSEHKKIYVGCAETDLRYRELLVNGRQRWSFHTRNTFDFLTSDRSSSASEQWQEAAESKIRKSDGVMMVVSEHTASDSGAKWEIACALSNSVPIVGVDIRKHPDDNGSIPEKLVGKMTRFGWEWFAAFIDGL